MMLSLSLLLLPSFSILITAKRIIIHHENISSSCSGALSEIHESTFSNGEKDFFMNRDRYLWDFRIMQCVRQIANEGITVASKTPTYYCYGDVRGDSQTVVLGACLPAQCYSDRLMLLEEYTSRLHSDKNTSAVENFYCIRSREKNWFEKPSLLVEFVLNKLLMLFVCFATLYQIRLTQPPKSRCSKVLLAFSVAENIKPFLPNKKKNKIQCIDGLRVPSTLWVIIGHSFWLVMDFLSNVDQYKNDLGKHFWAQWITNFLLSVDTFFTLTGLLTSYHWFLRLKKSGEDIRWNSWKHWLLFYIHRFLRLWPAYMYIMWVITVELTQYSFYTVFPPTNPTIQCAKYWWENALFINSLTDNKCIGWTWYISTSFIFHLISPIFLLSFKHSLQYGLMLSVSATLLSSSLNIIQIYRYNYPPTQMLFVQPVIYNQNYYQREITMYTAPQYRIGPYLVGLYLGYNLSEFKAGRTSKMANWLVLLGWFCAAVLGFGSLFGQYPALLGLNWPVYNLLYGGFHRTLWSLSVAWIIYACQKGVAGPVAAILQCPIFSIIAPLCYSAYLVHMAIIILVYSLHSFPLYYHSIPQILVYCAIQSFVSFTIALANVMLIEFPVNNLVRLVLPKKTIEPTETRNVITQKCGDEKKECHVLQVIKCHL